MLKYLQRFLLLNSTEFSHTVWICLFLSFCSPSHPLSHRNAHIHTQKSWVLDQFKALAMILLSKASGSSSTRCLGNVAGRKCLICPWRTRNVCACCVRVSLGEVAYSRFILLYVYSHVVKGHNMVTDYISSSTRETCQMIHGTD